jgi:hypothetical protein
MQWFLYTTQADIKCCQNPGFLQSRVESFRRCAKNESTPPFKCRPARGFP